MSHTKKTKELIDKLKDYEKTKFQIYFSRELIDEIIERLEELEELSFEVEWYKKQLNSLNEVTQISRKE